jgi:hypothetical protein
VATIAYEDNDMGYPARPPISAHPAFPAIVALWFSALLGLGSMVLPAVLVERALLATGLASLVPALNPPLDLPARGLVALAAALAGALIGLAIARRLANAQERQPAPRSAKLVASTPRQPISVHEELGGAGLVNGRGMPVTRRRALAITEDDRPSDFLYTAPLPGEDPYGPPAPTLGDANDDDPLELSEALVEDVTPAPSPEAAISPEDQPMPDRQEFRPTATFEMEDDTAAAVEEPQTDEQLGGEPLPFAAPSLARRLDRPPGAAEECAGHARVAADRSELETLTGETERFSADWATAAPESLSLMQLVQRLDRSIERRREWLAVCATVPAAVQPAAATAFEAAPAEEAVQAMAAYFGHAKAPPAGLETEAALQRDAHLARSAPLGVPQTVAAVSRTTFLQPFVSEADNEDDIAEGLPDFSLPLRRPAEPAASAAMAEEMEWEPFGEIRDADEKGYGSLLAMNNPFTGSQERFVRIDEPERESGCVEPAVVFPNPAPAPGAIAEPIGAADSEPPTERLFDAPNKGARPGPAAPKPAPADTESALRSALATLKRTNGAA